MLRCAIYARYSTNGQRETSIEDQVRRCRTIAAQNGLTVPDELVFADSAITGTAKGLARREGYQRLLKMLSKRLVDVVIADELSRLTRDEEDSVQLKKLARREGVRIITANGIDTSKTGWDTLWRVASLGSSLELEAMAQRTKRGMQGQLERGYQIAQAPYGYSPVHELSPGGAVIGTKWVIHPAQAEVIREMFELKRKGRSGSRIARTFNDRGIPPPGSHRKDGATSWRQSTVFRLLTSTTYRGVFLWNGSTTTKTNARRTREPLNVVEYPRPELRIVSDELWYAANPTSGSPDKPYRPMGSGKKVFSSLVRCGDCGAGCCVGTGNGAGTLYCCQCEAATRTGARESWVGYSSVNGARSALLWVFREVLGPGPHREEFNQRLEAHYRAGPTVELSKLTKEFTQTRKQHARLVELMADPGNEPGDFRGQYDRARYRLRELDAAIDSVREAHARLDPRIIEAQRNTDALAMLDKLLDGSSYDAQDARARLRAVIHEFSFIEKRPLGTSVFKIVLQPGVCLASASETEVIDRSEVTFVVEVRFVKHKPAGWAVEGRRVLAPEEEPATAPA